MLNSSNESRSSKKSISKIVLYLLALLFFLSLTTLIALPSILSTPWGNKKITQAVNSEIVGRIAFKKLHLSWFGEQMIEEAQLFNAQGQEIASMKSASAKVSLWKMLLGSRRKGVFELNGFNAHIARADGITNIQAALSSKKDTKVITEFSNPLVIFIKDAHASAWLDKKMNIIKLSGQTIQGDLQGLFNLNASIGDINKDKIFGDKKRLNTEQIGKIQIQANASNFPVSLLDEVLTLKDERYKGLLLAALGDKLDLDLQESKGRDGIDLKLKIYTPLLKGHLNGILKEDRLIVDEPDSLEVILQPKLVELFNQLIFNENRIQLKKPTKGHFNLSKLNLIFDFQSSQDSVIDLANSSILANFNVDQADLKISQPIGDITLQKLQLTIDASDNDKLAVNLDGQALRNKTTTQMNLKARLNKSSIPFEFSSLKNTEFALNLQGIPILLLDELAGKSNSLAEVIGKKVDAQLNFTYFDSLAATLKLNSEVLQSEVSANFSGSSMANSQVSFNAKVTPIENTYLYHILGPETHMQIDTAFAMNQKDSLKINDFNAEVKSNIVQAKIVGRLENYEKLYLTAPAILNYHLSPAAIQVLGLNNLKLDSSSKIHVNVDVDKRGIHLFDLSTLHLQGLLKIDQINLYGNAGALQQLSLPWEISGPQNFINFQIQGITKLNSGRLEGSLVGLLQISRWLESGRMSFNRSNLDSHIKLVNFPVAFIEKMTGQDDLIFFPWTRYQFGL